jgi:hypothetical protein
MPANHHLETSDNGFTNDKFPEKRRLRVLILALQITAYVILAALLALVFIPDLHPIVVRIIASHLTTVNEVLDYLDVPYHDVQRQRYPSWRMLVILGEIPEEKAILQAEAGGDNVRAVYANMALFRLRDQPDIRLAAICALALQEWPRESTPVITRFLTEDLDPETDKDYAQIIRDARTSLDNPDVQARLDSFDRRISSPVKGASLEWARQTFRLALRRLNTS